MDKNIFPAPLTLSQQGVYFACIKNPESTMYNLPFAVEISENLDIEKFENAIKAAAKKHPAIFATVDLIDALNCSVLSENFPFGTMASADFSQFVVTMRVSKKCSLFHTTCKASRDKPILFPRLPA